MQAVAGPEPQAQRVIRTDAGGKLKLRSSNANRAEWKGLSAEKRVQAYRMMNDYYRVYFFRDANHFYVYLDGAEAPTDVKEYHRRQTKATATGARTGKKDPLYGFHDLDASGGFAVEEKTAGLGGAPHHRFLETEKHRSNWASFVEVHHDGVVAKLDAAGKYTGAVKDEIQKLYVEAIKQADVMDKQEVRTNEQLKLSKMSNVWAGVAVEQCVNEMWEILSKELGQPRGSYAEAVLPRWGQLNNGMGTKVSAVFRSDVKQSIVVGSAAKTALFSPPWLEELRHRITMDARSLYVEGHLLNDHLGGSAAAYNLVPLTINANSIHLAAVENVVKNKVLQMLDEQALGRHGKSPLFNPINRIEYSVEADYSGFPRRQNTEKWIVAYNFLKHVIAALPAIDASYGGAMFVNDFRQLLTGGRFMPTVVDGKLLNYDETWRALQDPMNVVAWDRTTTSLDEALRRIDVISDVWLAEEKYVPVALICNSKTVLQDGSGDADGAISDAKVSNTIGHIDFHAPVRE